MEESTDKLEAVFRLSRRQKVIAEKLHNLVGPSLRAMYVDACRIVETDTKLQSEALLVGHLVREIESSLRSVLVPITDKKTLEERAHIKERQEQVRVFLNEISFPEEHPASLTLLRAIEEPDSHKKNIKAITSMLGLLESSRVCKLWLEIPAVLAKKAHRKGLARPECIDTEFRDEFWGKFEHLLLGVLEQMERVYLKYPEKVDQIKNDPTKENAVLLSQKLPNNVIVQRRFFEGNARKEWVALLKGRPIFTQPPNVDPLDDEEYINPPHWPVMDYLKVMADIKDEGIEDDIVAILNALPDTNNIRINSDIVELAAMLPIEKSLLLEDRIKQALSGLGGGIFMRDFSGLIKHWSPSGTRAHSFAAWLFDVEPCADGDSSYNGNFQTRFREYHYKETIQGSLESLMAADAIETLRVFCGLLDKAVNIECKGKAENEYTYIGRPDISETDSYGSELNTLIDAVKDCSVQIVADAPDRYAEVAGTLDSYQWEIFKRLNIYLLSRVPQADAAILKELLIHRENFDDHKLYYDYRTLAKAGFQYLPPSDQQTILSWLDEEPDIEEITQWYEEKKGRQPTEADIERIRAERFRHNAYGWQEALPNEFQDKYEAIVRNYGDETPINKVSGGWVGPESPISAETIASWDADKLIEYLGTWKPEEGIFMPTMEGLARVLQAAVSSDPGRYTRIADRLQGVHPTYVRGYLSGMEDALKEGQEIDWKNTLNLCLFIARHPDMRGEQLPDSWEADETWQWSKHKAIDLLKLGFSSDTAHQVPADCHEMAVALIEVLLDDENPTPEDEAKAKRDDEDDYYGVAIKSVRSQAIEVLIHYALRRREANPDISLQELPEVRAALDRHLDPAVEHSKAVRAVYGCFFPWLHLLDREWALENRERIFLKPLTKDSAWRTYVIYRKPFSDCYDVMKPLYGTAVQEEIKVDPEDKHRYFDRLCDHVVVHALRHNDKDRLLDNLVRNTPDVLLAHIMEFLGRILSDNQELPDDWKSTIRLYGASRIPHAADRELSGFGWWFANEHLDTQWMLENLKDVLARIDKIANQEDIIEYLAAKAEDHTEIALQCLEAILFETNIDYWMVDYKRGEITRILSIGLMSGTEGTMQRATENINRLVAKGYGAFEELLHQN